MIGYFRHCQIASHISFHSSSTEPPYDLVIAQKEYRPYKRPGGESKTPSTPGNSHNHVSMYLICAADPTFSAHELVIPDKFSDVCPDVQKGFLCLHNIHIAHGGIKPQNI